MVVKATFRVKRVGFGLSSSVLNVTRSGVIVSERVC